MQKTQAFRCCFRSGICLRPLAWTKQAVTCCACRVTEEWDGDSGMSSASEGKLSIYILRGRIARDKMDKGELEARRKIV